MLNYATIFLNEFVHLTVTVFPYFLIGVASGAFIEAYVKTDTLIKYLNKGLGSVVNASILGAVLPGCACATVPMAEGLKAKGSNLGTVASFIMASPLLAPQTLILTYGLLGLKFTLGRLIFALAGAILFGFICNWLQSRNLTGFQLDQHKMGCTSEKCACDEEVEKISFLNSFWNITKELGKYFLIGMVIASILSTFIPEEAIPKYIGSSGFLAFFLALIIGIPLYVCEGEEIPITLSLITLGLGQGPAMTFLLGSVGTCIPTFIMAQKVIGKKPMLLYIGYWFVFALGAGVVYGLI